MAEKIFNFDKLQNEYGELTIKVIENCGSQIDQILKQMLEKMIQKDWVAAWCLNGNSYESAGYIDAKKFIETSKIFHNFVGEHREFRENEENPYILKESFDDQMKLQAYEYLYPIIDEARILMFEISKYTKQQVPENIYKEEVEKIKQMHQELKETLQKQIIQQVINQADDIIDRPRNNFCNDICNIY